MKRVAVLFFAIMVTSAERNPFVYQKVCRPVVARGCVQSGNTKTQLVVTKRQGKLVIQKQQEK